MLIEARNESHDARREGPLAEANRSHKCSRRDLDECRFLADCCPTWAGAPDPEGTVSIDEDGHSRRMLSWLKYLINVDGSKRHHKVHDYELP